MVERQLFGRREIFTDEAEITRDNVVNVLMKAVQVHSANSGEIQYLYNYYRGKTPILGKKKEIRENINHKVAVNRAGEIVGFKLGYGFGEPIQYIRRGSDESLSDDIDRLNECMYLADKIAEDKSLAEWVYIGGHGYRMLLPGDEEAPLSIYTLDPRYSFVVKYNGLGNRVVMGVKFIKRENKSVVYSVYTKDAYFEIENGLIKKEEPHVLGDVPIFEYPANAARLGAFETVLPLLDAINELESNRMDDVVQFVNSFLALLGGTIDEETAKKLNEHKMLCLPDGVDAKYLSTSLNQSDVQVIIDDMYDAILTICGVPNRNGGSSTSDTGSAVIMRDGWESAEAQMKGVESEWKRSEKRFLRLALRILTDMGGTALKLGDIDIKFSRRNYDALLTKTQVLTTMLSNDKIHPELAFVHCGLFLDPESAYIQSKTWWEENEKKAPKSGEEVSDDETDPVSEV